MSVIVKDRVCLIRAARSGILFYCRMFWSNYVWCLQCECLLCGCVSVWMCIYGVDVLYVNIIMVMYVKPCHGVSWFVVEHVSSVSQVSCLVFWYVVMVLSRSCVLFSCSYSLVDTSSWRCRSWRRWCLYVEPFCRWWRTVTRLRSPVYSTIMVELYWLLITCKDPLILTT